LHIKRIKFVGLLNEINIYLSKLLLLFLFVGGCWLLHVHGGRWIGVKWLGLDDACARSREQGIGLRHVFFWEKSPFLPFYYCNTFSFEEEVCYATRQQRQQQRLQRLTNGFPLEPFTKFLLAM
jgi:hypothetical protein